MALFREDPTKFMDQYSRDFEQFFMEVMKRKGGLRVKANTVYQEVVADRTHIHMNATKWETLGTFVQYLGKTGLCRVDQTDKGDWMVQYIDRDPRFLARQEEIARRAEQSLDEEERAAAQMAKQIAEAQRAEEEARAALIAAGGEGGDKAAAALFEAAQPSELKEGRSEEEKIVFSMGHSAAAASSSAAAASSAASASTAAASSAAAAVPAAASSAPYVKPAAPFTMSLARPSLLQAFGSGESKGSAGDGAAKRKAPTASTLDSLMAENERIKSQEQAAKKLRAETAPPAPAAAAAAPAASSSKRLDWWLAPNIVVKVTRCAHNPTCSSSAMRELWRGLSLSDRVLSAVCCCAAAAWCRPRY